MTHSKPGTVVVALSGGVDSSIAAVLLLQQGYRVYGATMRLFSDLGQTGPDAVHDRRPTSEDLAREVCSALGIPFHVIDLRSQFREVVVDYLYSSYLEGLTPNPCVVCNRQIKFGALMRAALGLGAGYLATGHYARVRMASGGHRLLRGVDRSKDQSYMLYRLGQPELATVLFPLGEYHKTEVRAMAQRMGLPTAQRAESQDLCFADGGDYRSLLQDNRPEALRSGPIVDLEGRVLGQHRGIAFYTVGQRQGLGVAAGEPLYVLKIDAPRNALMVGPRSAVQSTALLAEHVHYVSGDAPTDSVPVTAKVRYRANGAQARLFPLVGQSARVMFDEPQFAVAPGQSVVFYQGEVVIGGGVIVSTESAED